MSKIFIILLLIVPSKSGPMERPPHRALSPRPVQAPPSPPGKRTYAQALTEQGKTKRTPPTPFVASPQPTQEESQGMVRHIFEDGLVIEELFLSFDCKYRGIDNCDSQFNDQESDEYWQHILEVHGIIAARYEENNIPIHLVELSKK